MVASQIKHLKSLIPLHSSQFTQVVALKVQLSEVRETLQVLYSIDTVKIQVEFTKFIEFFQRNDVGDVMIG